MPSAIVCKQVHYSPSGDLGQGLGSTWYLHQGTHHQWLWSWNYRQNYSPPQLHIQLYNFFEIVRPPSGNPPTLSQWQIILGLKAIKVKRNHPSDGEHVKIDPYLPLLEETSEEEQDTREYNNKYQQDMTNQAHASGDQDRPQDSSLLRISPITREMFKKTKDSDK